MQGTLNPMRNDIMEEFKGQVEAAKAEIFRKFNETKKDLMEKINQTNVSPNAEDLKADLKNYICTAVTAEVRGMAMGYLKSTNPDDDQDDIRVQPEKRQAATESRAGTSGAGAEESRAGTSGAGLTSPPLKRQKVKRITNLAQTYPAPWLEM